MFLFFFFFFFFFCFCFFFFFFFFFSSRRRHTRSLCDWSSDVCSSDLTVAFAGSDLPDFLVKSISASVWSAVEPVRSRPGLPSWLKAFAGMEIGRASCRERV